MHWAEEQLCLLCAEDSEGKKVTLLKESPSMYRQAQTAFNPQGIQPLQSHPPLFHVRAHLTGVVAAHAGVSTCNVQRGVVAQSSSLCLCISKAVLKAPKVWKKDMLCILHAQVLRDRAALLQRHDGDVRPAPAAGPLHGPPAACRHAPGRHHRL